MTTEDFVDSLQFYICEMIGDVRQHIGRDDNKILEKFEYNVMSALKD